MGISRDDEESQQEDLSDDDDDDDEGVRSTLTGHVVQFGRVRSRRWLASALVTACFVCLDIQTSMCGAEMTKTKKSLRISQILSDFAAGVTG